MIPVFYKHYFSSKVPNTSINQIQVELVWLLMLCHVASLFTFLLLPNLSRSLLAFSNSQIWPLRWYIQYWNFSMPYLISNLFHNFHRISIIGFIDVINVRGIEPSVHETPIWLFLSHVSYNSSQIKPMNYIGKYINLIIYPKTLGFP